MGYDKYFLFYLKYLYTRGKYGQAFSEILSSLWHRTVLFNMNFGHTRRYIPFLVRRSASYLRFSEPLEQIWKFDTIEERQIQDLDKYSVPALAHLEDRNSMAFGLEIRHPFLDHGLINLSLGIRTELKMKNG